MVLFASSNTKNSDFLVNTGLLIHEPSKDQVVVATMTFGMVNRGCLKVRTPKPGRSFLIAGEWLSHAFFPGRG